MSKNGCKIGLLFGMVFLVLASLGQTRSVQGAPAALSGDANPACCQFDFDENGTIDVIDIMAVASRWRCQTGDECYDERYDLDSDGDIDIVDIMLVSACWGEVCPTTTPTATSIPTQTPTPTPSDTESPEILEFGIERMHTDPVEIKITWRVSDSGGSYLDRIEIWRCPQVGSWSVIHTDTFPIEYGYSLLTGTFYDIPGNGFWWYKVKAYDRAGNYAESLAFSIVIEAATPTATSTPTPAVPDNLAPTITKFTLNLEGVSNVRICWAVFDEGGSHLNYARVWRANISGLWQQVGSDYHYEPNTDGPIEVCIIDSPGSGTWWYKVDIADNAGNVLYWGNLTITVEGPTPTSTSTPTATPTSASSDNIAPIISMFSVEPSGENALISWEASDAGGSHLNYTRIWVNGSYGLYYYDPYTDGPIVLYVLEDAPDQGAWLYWVDVVDNAGNETQSQVISFPVDGSTPTSTPTRTSTRTPASGSTATHTPTHTPTRTPGPGDNTAPVVTSFGVSPDVANGPITLSWTVHDQGGSHLSHTEVWRAPNISGSPGTWQKIGPNYYAPASFDGPWSSSATDNPTEGVWWYNIHVLDNNGNMGQGCASPASAAHFPSVQQLQTGLPMCTATMVDKTVPRVIAFWVDPYRYEYACPVWLTFNWIADDGTASNPFIGGFDQAEILRTSDPPDLTNRSWEQVAVKQAPWWLGWDDEWSDSIQVNVPPGGLWWYGVHIRDNAGNVGFEPEPPGPIVIVSPFLGPPVRGSTPAIALTGNTGASCGSVGRVNCWFDHEIPTKDQEQGDDHICLWTGERLPSIYNDCTLGENCYDGHDAIDFCGAMGEDIYAASSGTVRGISTEHVLVKHPNFFFTLYMHITPATGLKNGTEVTRDTKLGETNAENHLHFALYYDRNGNGSRSHAEIVDPFGWRPTTTGIVHTDEEDPWTRDRGPGKERGFRSYYFWYETSPIYNQMSSLGVTARIPQDISFSYAKGLK